MNLNKIAAVLDDAAMQAKATNQISLTRAITLEEAYAIQSISLGKRYQRGEKWIGLKMGFTSKAKMEQMGVHDLIWGRLTDGMHYKNKGILPLDKFIHPRAEPEIAFKIKKDVIGEVTLANAASFIEAITVAIEIIDSRYQNFKFSLEDVVADNCSSTGFALGDWHPVDTKIQDISISLEIDGKPVHEGNSNAILGNPWLSFVDAARLSQENGEILTAGSTLLLGAATPAVFLAKGQTILAKAQGLGSVTLQTQ